MGTPGNVVVTDDNVAGVLADGCVGVLDESGTCSQCCGTTVYMLRPCYPTDCDGLPKYLTVTFSGVSLVACETECEDEETVVCGTHDLNGTYRLKLGTCAYRSWTWYNHEEQYDYYGWVMTEDDGAWLDTIGIAAHDTPTSPHDLDVRVWYVGQGGAAGEAFKGEVTRNGWDDPIVITNEYQTDCEGYGHSTTSFPWANTHKGGQVTIVAGAVTENPSCPGGAPIYTDTDLSAHVGGVVKLNDGVWYRVYIDTTGTPPDGQVVVVDTGTSCEEVCGDE